MVLADRRTGYAAGFMSERAVVTGDPAPNRHASTLAIGSAVIAVAAVAVVLASGFGETGALALTRGTARTSLAFYLAAVAAAGFGPRSWWRQRRADWLMLFAISHTVHAGAIGWLAWETGGANLTARANAAVIVAGLGAYAGLYWLAWRPSFRYADVIFAWQWVVFAATYLPRVRFAPERFGWVYVALFLVPGWRLWRARRQRSG